MPATMIGGMTADLGNSPVLPVSVQGMPQIVVADATATAATATELRNILTFAGTGTAWVQVPDRCSRLLLRSAASATVLTTSPVVQVYAAWAYDSNGARINPTAANAQFTAANAARVARIDNIDLGAGLTLSFTTAGSQKSGAGGLVYYSAWMGWTTGPTGSVGDVLGATHVLVLPSTAAVVANGLATSWIEGLFL